MQGQPHTSSRSGQRRTPGGSGSGLEGSNSMSRNSYGATRSPSVRTESNLSKIEESVTNLLRATKELLETLTKWSRNSATEQEVSDIYVKLGSHFNIACRAFTAIGVETSDLGNVPDVLRTVLENTLSQDATPASLEVYLPRIREIIIDLLQGLRRKQKKLGPRTAGRLENQPQSMQNQQPQPSQQNGNSRPPGPNESSRPEQQAAQSRRQPRHDDGGGNDGSVTVLPERTTSLQSRPQGPAQNGQFSGSRGGSIAGRPYNLASGTMAIGGSQPQDPYYRDSQSQISITGPPTENGQPARERQSTTSELSPPPPPPPPKQDALEALSRAETLERRASRRYSAYHIAKHIGSSPSGMAMMPGGTPMRETTRDSINSIRERNSAAVHGKASKPRTMSALSRPEGVQPQEHALKARTPEEGTQTPLDSLEKSQDEKPVASSQDAKGTQAKTEPDPSIKTPQASKPAVDGTPTSKEVEGETVVPSEIVVSEARSEEGSMVSPTRSVVHVPSVSASDIPTKELTIFLQLGRSVKKVFLQDGLEELSLNTLRLLFISKFNYSPPSGDDFPELYLQDTASGVRYELEDMQDVKDRSVICLNVEVLDEVKRHIDDGMLGLRKMVESVHKVVESQAKAIQLVAEKQEDTSKKVGELSIRGVSSPGPAPSSYARFGGIVSPPTPRPGTRAQMSEVQAIKRDLQTLRSTYATFCTEMKTNFVDTKRKAVARIGEASGLASEGRLELETAKKTLSSDTDTLVSRVDDLQDAIEDLRKDVVARGVRPLPRQLESASKEIIQARKELKKMAEYIKTGKPLWKKVWERELEVVCEDQQFFNLQEELVADLQDDLDKASQTFELVDQCTEQQLKSGPGAIRSGSRGFVPIIEEPLDPSRAKNNMLMEVKALKPNHENRVEAIERAERARQKELEGRTSPFKQELGKFVEESRLKKTGGGVMETERLRALKDEEIRKGIFKPPSESGSNAGSDGAAGNDAGTVPNGIVDGQDVPVIKMDAASENTSAEG